MDYHVFKAKITKPEPAPAPKPAPPPESSPKPPSPPHQGPTWPGPSPIPFMVGGYMEDLDRMSRIPRMRDFEVTYSKTYRWNLTDPMEDYNGYHSQDHHYHGQPMAYRGTQWLPPPHPARALPPPRAAQALPSPPPRRLLGPPPEYGPPGMLLAPTHHPYNYPYAPPAYGPYGGGGGYYDDQHPEDCRVM